jgi:PA domain-containing protein
LHGSRLLARAAVVTGVAAAGVWPAAALADDDPRRERGTGAKVMVPDGGYDAHSGHQHGDNMGHLEPTSENVKLLGKLELTEPFGDVAPEQIADVALHDGYAYLTSWAMGDNCTRGGVFIVDARNPRKPKQLDFIPALTNNYHGEGADVLEIRTKQFKGDVLAVNNEYCDGSAFTARGGGMDLYDVTNPKRPKTLVQGFGDFGPEGSLTDPSGQRTGANSSHNTVLWSHRGKAYAAVQDNTEFHDVDIFDISDPRSPKPVAEHDLVELFPSIVETPSPNGNWIYNHDDFVKIINGRPVMIASYWDAGYVTLDMSDPANPDYIGDNDFGSVDPLFPELNPEGSGHQAEFSHDNRYILGADEDFAPYRSVSRIPSDPDEGTFVTVEPGDTASPIFGLPDHAMNGPTTYVGRACTPDSVPAAGADDGDPNTEQIAAIERGECNFSVKIANVAQRGWQGYVVFNDANRPDGDPLVNMQTLGATIPGVFMSRADALRGIFDGASTTPAIGDSGRDFEVAQVFDGWGYAQLYRNRGGKLERVDSYAIPEARDEDFAFGFGDLSIHEFATDGNENLAYSSYYSGGLRVFEFGWRGFEEVGRFIDEGGNNFWGVEFDERKDVIAASDRDYGLYLFEYDEDRRWWDDDDDRDRDDD